MKTLLEDLDLSPSGGVMLPPIYPHHRRPDDAFVDEDDYEALKKALVAALGVIEKHNQHTSRMSMAFAYDKLEAALKPFKKEPSDEPTRS